MKLIWLHTDCLHRHSPAYRAYPHSPSLFVWDDAELRSAGWTLKRIGFIYECLLDLPVTIRRGDPVKEVLHFAQELGCSGIATVASLDPHIQKQASVMGAKILPLAPLFECERNLELGRFSHYWRRAERALLGEERRSGGTHQR